MSDLYSDELLIMDLETDIQSIQANLSRHEFFYKKMLIEHEINREERQGKIDVFKKRVTDFLEAQERHLKSRTDAVLKEEDKLEDLLNEQSKAKKLKEETIKKLSKDIKDKNKKLIRMRGN